MDCGQDSDAVCDWNPSCSVAFAWSCEENDVTERNVQWKIEVWKCAT